MRFSLAKENILVEILQRFRMMDCKSMATHMVTNMKLLNDSYSYLVDPMMYKKLIGSLMYLVNTKPNIYFAVNTLSQYMVEPRHVYLVVAKYVFRFLHGTVGYGLIQVDIGGHPPFPNGSKQFSCNFGNLLFLAVFNFWGHFEGLNEGF